MAKAQYIKQADAICAKTEEKQQALITKMTKDAPPRSKKAQLDLISQAGLPPLSSQVEELEDLPEPKTDADQAEAYLAELSTTLERVEEDPELMLKEAPFVKAEEMAAKFGFKACRGA